VKSKRRACWFGEGGGTKVRPRPPIRWPAHAPPPAEPKLGQHPPCRPLCGERGLAPTPRTPASVLARSAHQEGWQARPTPSPKAAPLSASCSLVRFDCPRDSLRISASPCATTCFRVSFPSRVNTAASPFRPLPGGFSERPSFLFLQVSTENLTDSCAKVVAAAEGHAETPYDEPEDFGIQWAVRGCSVVRGYPGGTFKGSIFPTLAEGPSHG
jgi:hypothetical protein